MSQGIKIILTILLILVMVLSGINVSISATRPGLHYLVVIYGSGITLFFGLLFFLLTMKTKRLKFLSLILIATALLTYLPTNDLDDTSRMFILVVNALAVLACPFSIRLTWRWR